jgi:hypothetical protein
MKAKLILAALFVLLAACAPAQATSTPECESCDPIDPQGGTIYIDSSDLLVAESYPVQIFLHITGNLPTPCHEFRSQVPSPDEQNRIYVTAWSESDPNTICIQVLEPFDTNISISMEDAAEGSYTVWLNGEKVGEFNYPA